MRKKIYYLLLITIVCILSACSKDSKSVFLDPNSKISLQGESMIARSAEIDTIDIIVRHCDNIRFKNNDGLSGMASLPSCEYYFGEMNGLHRDFENRRFLWSGEYVIESNPNNTGISRLGNLITNTKDVVFAVPVDNQTGEYLDLSELLWFQRPFRLDTLGYIPNKILKKAQQDIQEAYATKDFATCYHLFDAAFQFYPITGERWRALKSAGIE